MSSADLSAQRRFAGKMEHNKQPSKTSFVEDLKSRETDVSYVYPEMREAPAVFLLGQG